jgi:uncharacterized membrane protein (UPF0127 family)
MRETAIELPNRWRIYLLVPETEVERVRGMNDYVRPSPYTGMVFNFDPPQVATMTMEQTPMPLRISFVGPDRIVHTVHDAPAFSGVYTSRKPARWVIETIAPQQLGILKVGDLVRFV